MLNWNYTFVFKSKSAWMSQVILKYMDLQTLWLRVPTRDSWSQQSQIKSESSLLLASKSITQKEDHATRIKRAGVKPSVTAVTYRFSDYIELLQYIYCEICLLHCKILGPLQRYYGCQVRRGWIESQGTREEKRQKRIEGMVDAFWTCPETRTVSLVQWLLLVSGRQMVLLRKRKARANGRAGSLVATAAINLNTASVLQGWLTQEHERNAELRATAVKQCSG
jgi:hypothetical protein